MLTDKLKDQMKQQFHMSAFRPGQEEIITDVMNGHDVLAILPTGSGKSLCYQLPASLLPGVTIVVSPLISLMEDQVKQLKATGFKAAVALNSFMDPHERLYVLQQLEQYKLIYLSPESLQRNDIIRPLKQMSIDLFVVDEAHCISQWGHEFRPDYLRLKNVLNELSDPAVMALSATATEEVQEDIMTSLDRPDIISHIHTMDRENITLTIKKVNADRDKQDMLLSILKRYRVPTLIYFSSKRKTEEMAAYLSDNLSSHRVSFYHGGMDQFDRITIQQQFMNSQLDVICCTSAFGMGINKSDIRLVVHYHFPLQIENYLQEIGRAGRDGKSSVSLLFYAPGDEALPKTIIDHELPPVEDLSQIFRTLYDLYLHNPQLPASDKMLDILQLNETQWRFLHHQMETHGMIKDNRLIFHKDTWEDAILEIKQFLIDRVDLKTKKLEDITAWINETRCLREQLYQKFQSGYKAPLHACCSNCGFSFDNWEPEQIEEEETALPWGAKLKKLFFTGDYHRETK